MGEIEGRGHLTPTNGGRPTKLDPATTEAFTRMLRATGTISIAAQHAGISRRTIYNWLQEAETTPTPENTQFLHDVEKAKADWHAEQLLLIKQAATGYNDTETTTVTHPDGTQTTTQKTSPKRHWQAAAWLLERKLPNEYSLHRNRTEITETTTETTTPTIQQRTRHTRLVVEALQQAGIDITLDELTDG